MTTVCAVSSCLTLAPRFLSFHKKRTNTDTGDTTTLRKLKKKKKKISHLRLLMCIRRPELCTEAACDRDRVRSSPNNLQKDCKHARKKGSSTEVKKEGLNVFKY